MIINLFVKIMEVKYSSHEFLIYKFILVFLKKFTNSLFINNINYLKQDFLFLDFFLKTLASNSKQIALNN